MRRLHLAAALLLLAAAAPAPAQEPGTTPAEHFEQALEAFRKGEYGQAAIEAMEVPAGDPLHARARYLLGECWLATGDMEDAEEVFRGLLESKPDAVPALTGLGRALAGQGKHDAAEEVLRRAARLDRKDPAPRRALGESLAARGKPVEARKELEAAAGLDPADPLTARLLVEILVKAGDTGGAARAAERLQRADPKSAMGDFLRALVHDRAGAARDAMAGYEKALEKDPSFLDAHKNIAILCIADNPLYKDRERTEKAFRHIEKYFELGGEDRELREVFDTIKAFLERDRGE